VFSDADGTSTETEQRSVQQTATNGTSSDWEGPAEDDL